MAPGIRSVIQGVPAVAAQLKLKITAVHAIEREILLRGIGFDKLFAARGLAVSEIGK